MTSRTQTFYAQEAANRRNSFVLVGFVTLVLGLLVGGITAIWGGNPGEALGAGVIGVGAGLIAALVSYYAGGSMVLSASDAKEVSAQDEPQLFNVVSELSIAAGIPMPKVYVIEDESLNAFATGRDPAHASVAITRGLLERLDREELQGVLGHELSHVRNLDIRYSLLVGVMVGSIVFIADILLRVVLRGVASSRKGSGTIVLVVFSIALAAIAVVVAKLVELAASRQREYLADASSAELTRNPRGLERALLVLADSDAPFKAANRATQHLFIVNPLKRHGGHSLFSTHPPLGERIERLRKLTGEGQLSPDDEQRLDSES
jgi:heat shock protein HtpX